MLGIFFAPFALLFPLIVVAAIVFIVFGLFQGKRRRDEMQALARKLGLSFHEKHVAPSGQSSSRRGFFEHVFASNIAGPPGWLKSFRRGSSRTASNTIIGQLQLANQPCEIWMGDWRYTTGSGKNRSTHRRSYVTVRLPHGSSDLSIRPENAFDWMAGMVGIEDIDFESVEFSKKFHVKGGDRRFVYDLIDPGMIEFLLRQPMPIGQTQFEFERGWFVLLVSPLESSQFEACLEWIDRFLRHWPRHLQAPSRG